MQPAELRDSAALLGVALGEVTGTAREVHKAVSGRVFGMLGRAARPVRVVHDGIAALAYGSTRFGVHVVSAVAGAGVAQFGSRTSDSLHTVPHGHFVLNVLSGLGGDRLAHQCASLAPQLCLRTHDGELRQLPSSLVPEIAGAATGRIVVFVHGLCETDRFWWQGGQKRSGDVDMTYGSQLRDKQGWTPLYASYNTGLHISENGRELADRLDALIAQWPTPVAEVALIGHSMGGLVVRSAAHQADVLGQSWVGALTHIVALGAPHLGAPLERFVNAATHRLSRLPETRPLAIWLNRRSVGIKDLRYGAVLAEDWCGVDPDEPLRDHCIAATLLPQVSYCNVSMTLSRSPQGSFAHDLLVQHHSAHGIGPARRIPFDPLQAFHVGRKTHFHLLNDPLVCTQLQTWLAQ